MAPKKRATRSSPATTTTTTAPITDAQLKELIAQGVADVLAEHDATRSRIGEDSHDSRTGVRRQTPLARECTYSDFIKCKPVYFKGIEGVVKLTQRFERMETVFRISNCTMENQIKFATCTLLGSDLTWKEYAGTLPLCNKCKFHHNGQCTVKCANYKRVGHLTRDCRSPAATNNKRNPTCYEYGNQGHYKSDCPKLRNQNHENQAGGTGARGMVHALGGGETNQDLNDMKNDINAQTLLN
uniref:CCHC-type domain-containing protein n=1 Tax=Tanacetum cinerariifolium TaxID=118510 RepID=A0A6L2M6J9_TANCI|nr:hypothetical protein [Tanacetum cinerariifolium]